MILYTLKSRNTVLLLLILLWFAEPPQRVAAQTIHQFTQFYFNPSLLNPSFTGSDGRPALFLAYKKQWAGIDGSPSIANVNFQIPLPSRVNIGFNFSNDKNGLLNSSGVLVSGGYTLPVGENQFLRFGLSVGVSSTKVDMNSLYFGTSGSDPILTDLAKTNFQVMGNAGISFHSHSFHVGAAIPNLFQPDYLNKDVFTVSKVNPFESLVFHASHRFFFANGKNIFEPYLIYRLNSSIPSQYEVAGVFHIQNAVYAGVSYKQDFGISALAGFKVSKQVGVGYSYTIKNTGINELNKPSHEVHLGILFGKQNKNIPVYSFVDTEKENTRKKTRAQVAAEKRKHDAELAAKKKKKNVAGTKPQELAARKVEEERKKQGQITLAKAKEKEMKNNQPIVDNKPVEEVKTKPIETIVEKKQEPDNTVPSPAHNGGTRLRHTGDLPKSIDKIDSVLAVEEKHLLRLEEHADDPTAHHNEDNHPNADRHEFVKRGEHHAEMDLGDYVIAGAFSVEANAKKFSDGLIKLGFEESDFGFLTQNKLWYVHISQSSNIETAKKSRDKFRKMKMFKEAWLLTVHK